jgi:predicted nucleic acid-binding protein
MLVDTNVLACLLSPHPQRKTIREVLKVLATRGAELHVNPQNLIELWVLATRPVDQNGLGLSASEAAAEIGAVKAMFVLLVETPAVYPAWENIVVEHGVTGKSVHDARLVAAMRVHGVPEILTFDGGFARYTGIQVLAPSDVTNP